MLLYRLTSSAASDKNYHKFEHLLSPGWVPGRKIVCIQEYGSALELTSAGPV